MTSRERNTAFAKVMEKVLAGLSQREVRRRTGISATYVGDMLWGIVPSYQILLRMAEGLEWTTDQAREVFTAAGYAPPLSDEGSEPSAAPVLDALELRIRELSERYGAPDLTLRLHNGDDALTPEAVDRWAERMEDFLKDLQAEQSKD